MSIRPNTNLHKSARRQLKGHSKALLQKFCLRIVVREITLLQTSSWLEV